MCTTSRRRCSSRRMLASSRIPALATAGLLGGALVVVASASGLSYLTSAAVCSSPDRAGSRLEHVEPQPTRVVTRATGQARARACGNVAELPARLYVDHGVKRPPAGHASEFVLATLLERDPGPDDEILDGARRQDDTGRSNR